MSDTLLRVVLAESAAEIGDTRVLLREYEKSLPFTLCFQSFEQELAGLPGSYKRPAGRLLLAYVGQQAAGCVALRALEAGVCEMKRLYVKPEFRKIGLGRLLVGLLIGEAREIGYGRMRLDTVESAMQQAVALYRRLGFMEVPAYCENPNEGVLYMELTL